MKRFDKIWDAAGSYKKSYQPDVEKGFSRLKNRIASENTGAKVVSLSPLSKMTRIAAALLILLAAGYLFKQFSSFTELNTFASELEKSAELQLADGSKVWLNENSEVSYPETFGEAERRVFLKGEGFFEIEKNPNKPFIVETESAIVKVLGTSFNMRAYKKEDVVSVNVKSEKVAFQPKGFDEKLELTVKEKGIFNKKDLKLYSQKETNPNDYAWKTGELIFFGTPLKEVFQTMEKFYKVSIKVESSKAATCKYSTNLNNLSLEEAFEGLKEAFQIGIEQDKNGTYIIRGGTCSK